MIWYHKTTLGLAQVEERLTVVANKHQTVAGSSPATQIMLHREAYRSDSVKAITAVFESVNPSSSLGQTFYFL